MKRPLFIALVGLLAMACAACGGGNGGGKHAAGKQAALPAPLLQRIKAEIQKPSVIGGAASATAADVYGPASYSAVDKAWEGHGSAGMHVSGRWYLIVLHGNFQWNGSVPPGAKVVPADRKIGLVVWSPNARSLRQGGMGFSVANRVPSSVSALRGPATVDLS